PPPPVVTVPTFRAVAEKWLERHAALGARHGTHAIRASAVEHHLLPFFGDREVRSIDASAVEDWIVHLRRAGSVRFKGRALTDAAAGTVCELWARVGARAGEITALRPMDVDYDAGTIWIRQTYSRGRVGPTKTAKSTRRISFGCPILEDVADWRPRPEVVAAM